MPNTPFTNVELEGIDQRIDKVSILEDTRLTFHYRCDRITDPVVQRQVGQRVVALPEHKGLEDQQCDRHDDAENEEQEQHGRDQRLMLAQTDRGGTAALAADGGVGLARADQLLVDKYRDRAMQIMMSAMANAVWVFWDLLFMYSWLDRVTKLTLEPK